MWVTLDTRVDGAGEELLPRLQAIVQQVAALQRTLLGEGIDGISGALKIARLGEEALGRLSAEDIAWMRAELHRRTERLRRLAEAVDEVRELKQRLADPQAAVNVRR